MHSPRLIAILTVLGTLAACSGGDGSSKGAAAPPAGTGSGAASGDDESSVSEAEPVALTASVNCSSRTATTFVSDPQAAESTTACIVLDAEAKPLVLQSFKVVVSTKEGDLEPPLVAKDVEGSPWQIGMTLSSAQLAALVSIKVSLVSATGIAASAATDNVAYDWSKDPLFAEVLAATSKFLAVFYPDASIDEFGVFADARLRAQPYHVIFATDQLFDGAIGIEAADAACAEAGKAVDPSQRWKALMGSASAPPSQRLRLKGPVRAINGELVANPEDFFAGRWSQGVRYTESRAHVLRQLVDEPPRFASRAWSGMAIGGGHDVAGGNCGDWTSRDQATTGRQISAFGHGEEHDFLTEIAACDQRARLVCVSQDGLVPDGARFEKNVPLLAAGSFWSTVGWSECDANDACTIKFRIDIASADDPKAHSLTDLEKECGRRFAPTFDFSWSEPSKNEYRLELRAVASATGKDQLIVWTSSTLLWTCPAP